MNVETNPAGFLVDMNDWSPEVMEYLAEQQGQELTEEIIGYVMKAREMYEDSLTVPPLRVFSKETGGDRKGSHLNKLFNGGPMKKIALIAGLPQPTGLLIAA